MEFGSLWCVAPEYYRRQERWPNETWASQIGFLALVNTAHTAVLCYELYVELVRDQRGTDVVPGGWAYTAHLAFLSALCMASALRLQQCS